jgi:YbgC/YbaW family acyl-CoA thioester hydrolase
MPDVFHTTRRVEFVDTDKAGIVHFSNFFRYMETAEVEFLRARGLSVAVEWEGQRLGFPRVAASCEYTKPVTFEDVLDVEVRLERVGRKSLTYAFTFAHRGEVVARGQVSSCCCRVLDDRRIEAVEIPAALRERLLGS